MREALPGIRKDLIDYFLKNRGTATTKDITETLNQTLRENLPLINSFFSKDKNCFAMDNAYLEHLTEEANAITIARFGGGKWDLWDFICQFFKMFFCLDRELVITLFVEEKLIRKEFSTFSKYDQLVNEDAGKNLMLKRLCDGIAKAKNDFNNKDVSRTCFAVENNIDKSDLKNSKTAQELYRTRENKTAT